MHIFRVAIISILKQKARFSFQLPRHQHKMLHLLCDSLN